MCQDRREPSHQVKRQKTRNEIASEREIELWREYYKKNPDKWQKLLQDAEQARTFLKLLSSIERKDD